jgi:Putative sensor
MSGGTSGAPGPAGPDSRLTPRRDPLRLLFSGSLWRSAGYLAAYLFGTGWLLWAAAFASVLTALLLAVTIAGVPLFTAAAAVLRGGANVERARLRLAFREPVRGRYRSAAGQGVLARARTHGKDPATWRDFAYLFLLWPPLFAFDLAVLTIWLVLAAGVASPLYYWAVPFSSGAPGQVVSAHGLSFGSFPHGPHGPGGHGLFIGTLPQALGFAAVSLVLLLAFDYVLVAAARAHASVARGLLRAPADPLAAARDVLGRPGPLPPLLPVTPDGRPPAGSDGAGPGMPGPDLPAPD